MLLLKIFKFSTPEMLRQLLLDVPISTFLVSLIKDNNPAMVATGVRIAEVLMEKLPDVFQTFFVKVFPGTTCLKKGSTCFWTCSGQETPSDGKNAWVLRSLPWFHQASSFWL